MRPHRWQPTRLPRPSDSPGKNTGVGCHFLLQCMKVKVKSLSHVRLLVTPWTAAHQAPPPMGFSRQEYWSGVPEENIISVLQKKAIILSTVQVSWSVAPTLCDPMDCSTPGFPVHHQLPEFTQTHFHWVGSVYKVVTNNWASCKPDHWILRHMALKRLYRENSLGRMVTEGDNCLWWLHSKMV